MRNMNSFLHEIEMWTTLQWCTLNRIELQKNWIEIKLMILNWKQMRYKLTKKNIQNLLVNMMLKRKTLEKHKRKHIFMSHHFLRMG